jgi:hypothetical protein
VAPEWPIRRRSEIRERLRMKMKKTEEIEREDTRWEEIIFAEMHILGLVLAILFYIYTSLNISNVIVAIAM